MLEESLLQATDRAVRRLKVNRSALIRDALRDHLRRLSLLEQERRDREGYARHPTDSLERPRSVQAQLAKLAASGLVILPTGKRLTRVPRVRVSGPPVSRAILEDRR